MKYNSVVLTLSSQQSSSTFQLLQLTNPWNEHERRRGCGSVLRSVCLYLYYKLIFTCHKNHGGADPGFLWLTAENGDGEHMKACFSCPWSLSLSLPSRDVRSRVQVWVRQKENHTLPQPEQPTWTTPSHISPSLCSWCILVCNPSSRLFIMTGSTRGDCHRLRDGNMKRSCLSVSGSGEVTVFSSDVQPSSMWKKNEGVRSVLVSLPFDIVLDDCDYDILVSQSYIWWLRPL